MRRLWFVFILLIILFFIIIFRLFYLQIIVGNDYREQADKQHYLEMSLPAWRGSIKFQDGNYLALNQPAYLVYAQPNLIANRNIFAREIAPLLNLDSIKLENDINIPNRLWIPLAHKIDGPTIAILNNLNLIGIGYEKEPKRFYPEASMAAQLLGFVGSAEDGSQLGYFGIEGFYDRELRGKDGIVKQEKDVNGNPIIVGDVKRVDAENGRDLTLWIDRTVQKIVENNLEAGMEKYGAKEGTVIVMDPKTGGILAMASEPKYDPGAFDSYTHDLYSNPAVADSYEPGSTFKTLVMSAGLNERLITPNTIINENGPVKVGVYLIKTWNDQYHGNITMTDVLVNSSNVGMVFVGRKLGEAKMLQYIHNFGFGIPTRIDLQDESSPELRPDTEWKEIDLATATFGQGIAVTPIQMVRAVSALANGGWLMEPHIVKEIQDNKGNSIMIQPKKIRQVITSDTARIITEMMIASVDRGEAKFAKPVGFRIAGKTGTAQIPVAGHYDNTKTIASFVGFAPADDPKFVMLVTLREPSSSQWGSETAAPLFFNIAKELFNYYSIAPQ
jgi:stage V sporulation protein D (sporulation-specific penicillin-binding protein)